MKEEFIESEKNLDLDCIKAHRFMLDAFLEGFDEKSPKFLVGVVDTMGGEMLIIATEIRGVTFYYSVNSEGSQQHGKVWDVALSKEVLML